MIGMVCDDVKKMLLEKNAAYGNSALKPIRCFSKASPKEQLLVRMDDKLSRLAYGNPDAFGEDVVNDLIGYLVLYKVHLMNEKMAAKPVSPVASPAPTASTTDPSGIDAETIKKMYADNNPAPKVAPAPAPEPVQRRTTYKGPFYCPPEDYSPSVKEMEKELNHLFQELFGTNMQSR